jgi:hypothetical protein
LPQDAVAEGASDWRNRQVNCGRDHGKGVFDRQIKTLNLMQTAAAKPV